jgi:DinB superfamily
VAKTKKKAQSKPKTKSSAKGKAKPKTAAKSVGAVAVRKNGNAAIDGIAVLREQLSTLLKGGGAHVQFMDAIDGFPESKRGTYVQGLPHTGWQLLEHSRIAQWDILEFSRNASHVSPDFPDGYWPKTPGPPSDEAWQDSVAAFRRDLRDMIRLVENSRTDLYAKIAHGDGQTVLREALVLADHNSYHLGQLVDLRRALGSWPEQ